MKDYSNCKNSEKQPICETHVRENQESSSEEEYKGNALAPGADEGRDKLR